MYQQIREAWKKPDIKTLRERMIDWRKSNAITDVEKPLRLDRARALGYKSKKGFKIVRVRVRRGGHKRPRPNKGRRSKRLHTRKNLKMNYKWIAEQRAGRTYKDFEVHYFYEVILVNPNEPTIKNDKKLNWISKSGNKGRVFRGLTSAGKKSRGLRASKGRAHKVRPSVRAGGRKGK